MRAIATACLLCCAAATARAALMSPQDIYRRESPAVVLLVCVGEGGKGELGTGSVIDREGRVVTNAHVVVDAASGQPYSKIRAYFKPARLTGDPKRDLADPRRATVVSVDRALDLALLKLEDSPSVSPIPLGDADAVQPGEPVVAIGHPEQGGLWTLTTGVVSTVVADMGGVKGKDAFQTDASINRGNSGGPLLGPDGAMIGVNTSMARKASDGLTITSVNFSLKSSVVKTWLASAGYVAPVPMPAASPAKAADEAKPVEPAKSVPGPTPAPEPAKAIAAVAVKPAPEPKPAPAPEKPLVETVPAKPAADATPAPKPQAKIATPARPYKIDDVIAQQMREMEDMGREMHEEFEKRRPLLGK